MFILIPIFFLFAVAAAILIMQWVRPSFGFSWLIASLAAFLAWLSLIILRLRLPLSLVFIQWRPQDLFSASPTLSIDRFSWPYATGLAALVLAAILTASVRSLFNTSPYAWAGTLAVAAIGLIAIFAGNPLTLLMAWAAVDLVELFILQASVIPGRPTQDDLAPGDFAERDGLNNTSPDVGATVTGEAPGLVSENGVPVSAVLADGIQSREASIPAVQIAGQSLSGQGQQVSQRIVLAYSSRTAGVLLIFMGMILGGVEANTFSLKHISIQAGLLILAGCGLRLGVLPLHLPFSQEPRLRRGLGTILRLVPVVSTLVLLARLPADIIPEGWSPWLLALVTLAALYGGGMWLAAEDELTGRPYWMLAWAALAFSCTIRGAPIASVAWGVALLLSGGFLFLYSARNRYLLFLPVLGVWGMIGLPYSPGASGWAGLFGKGVDLLSVLEYIALLLLLVGFLKHAFRKADPLSGTDRWAQAVYPLGLILIMVTDNILGGWGWPGSLTNAYWWAGILPVLLCLLVWVMQQRMSFPNISNNFLQNNWIVIIIKNSLHQVSLFTRLDWLYRLVGLVYGATGRLLDGITAILEGDGGVLWAILLLSLMISLISLGGS